MIFLFNALAWGFEHAQFDAAFIAATAQAFPGEPIHYRAEKDHSDQTRRYLETRFQGAQVSWRDLDLPPRLASARERIAQDFRTCQGLLSEAKRLGASRVIACYMHSTTGMAALKALSFVYRPSVVAFVHHGSLLRLISSRRYHPLLSLANGHLRQIVLGSAIRSEVLSLFPTLRSSLYAVRHPYFFEETVPSELPESGPMSFSFLGLVDENKGFGEFVQLATTIAPAWSGAARFDLIGGTRAGALPTATGPVASYSAGGPMPRDAFEAHLRETTYAVMPYNPSFYRYIASGSMLDALAAGKPLIALRNSSFEEMFDVMGDIGYLCNDLRDMGALVTALLREPPRDRYRQQSKNILAGRHIFETGAVAEQLREALAAP